MIIDFFLDFLAILELLDIDFFWLFLQIALVYSIFS